MQALQKMIHQAIQLGGTLIFIKEGSPANLSEWMIPLQSGAGAYKIPFALRSLGELTGGSIATKPQDLCVLFAEQESLLPSLDSCLQGQRLMLNRKVSEKLFNIDFHLEVDLKIWRESLAGLDGLFIKALDLQDQMPCLFLDRDDVIIENVLYNGDPAKVVLQAGIVELIKSAHEKSYWVAMVTNQSGLGRGRISWKEYQAVHQQTLKLLAQQGVWLDESEWSAFIEEPKAAIGENYAGLRKPRNGMFLKVQEKLKVNMSASMMIGDSATDLIAAFSAGVGQLYLLKSAKFAEEKKTLEVFAANHSEFKFQFLNSLAEAARVF